MELPFGAAIFLQVFFEMEDRDQQNLLAWTNELRWLHQLARSQPSHWVLSRIAEVEGMVAACRERVAWGETRRLVARLKERS
ncbi:MAG: hypothetical protein M0017_10725 [Desulfobacteraceae bacterium]|nr:hypothetical protein [Desulfobacteraceae bacterium]